MARAVPLKGVMATATTSTSEGFPRSRYVGPERRKHRVFVTRNSEYHCRDEICVAVRDLRSGTFLPRHRAIGRRMTASFRVNAEGGIDGVARVDEVHVGEQLCFTAMDHAEGHELLTSPVRAVERPPKEIVAKYLH
jgi:hypothetical protein